MDSDITKAARNYREFKKIITSAANAGNVLIGTINTQTCRIESITQRAISAAQTDLTTAATYGGVDIATHTIVFIPAVLATKANLTNINDQLGWEGKVSLPAGSVIAIELVGTGATPVNLEIVVEYVSIIGGGYIS